MWSTLRDLAAYLPEPLLSGMRRRHHARMIRLGTFGSRDPEIDLLPEWLSEGDVAVDVGANVGEWARHLSEAVGPTGRVFAFEPVPSTFALLVANVKRFSTRNVTAVHAAVSDEAGVLGMTVPTDRGLEGPWFAYVTHDAPDFEVQAVTLDSWLPRDRPVALVKIDTEGHDAHVLRGMRSHLERDRPRLVLETRSEEVDRLLAPLGYRDTRLPGSPNVVYEPG